MNAPPRIWIQGAGEMASGAAVALLEDGCRVVLAEIPNPLSVRRLACFSEAVYEGAAVVAGWRARLVSRDGITARGPSRAQVVVDPAAAGLADFGPDVVVDARMTKQVPVALPLGGRPLVGLGPGFICGDSADLVVETMRGRALGQVLAVGSASPNTGVPGPVGGHTGKRLLRAPAAGRLVSGLRIGDLVQAGQEIGRIGGLPVVSRLDGLLRGLVHERAELLSGEKVGDVDPRGAAVEPAELTDKAQAIGEGVRRAVRDLMGR